MRLVLVEFVVIDAGRDIVDAGRRRHVVDVLWRLESTHHDWVRDGKVGVHG